jgi:hypothetical protein
MSILVNLKILKVLNSVSLPATASYIVDLKIEIVCQGFSYYRPSFITLNAHTINNFG